MTKYHRIERRWSTQGNYLAVVSPLGTIRGEFDADEKGLERASALAEKCDAAFDSASEATS